MSIKYLSHRRLHQKVFSTKLFTRISSNSNLGTIISPHTYNLTASIANAATGTESNDLAKTLPSDIKRCRYCFILKSLNFQASFLRERHNTRSV